MIIREKYLGPLVIVIFALGIILSMVFNLWKTEGKKVPVKITSGEAAGQYDPADIRGSYTFADLEKNFGIPVEVLAEAFGVDKARAASFQNKELESIWEEAALAVGKDVGNDAMKLFVSLYLDLPFSAKETTALPAPAVRILKEKRPDLAEKLSALSLPE